MKYTLVILLLVLLLCVPGMAQTTTAKPTRGLVNNTASSDARNDITWSASSGSIITTFYTIPPPITIDGETTDCTQPHLIKALKIAAENLKDPNQPYDCCTIFLLPPDSYSAGYLDSTTPAQRMRAEANRLEAGSKRVQWVRAVLAECSK